MPSGSIETPRTIASRSSAERTSSSSSCASLVMRWRDCQRQSFHSATVAVGKKRCRKASVCGLIGGRRRRSGTTPARGADEGGVDTEDDDEEQVSFAAAGADKIGRRTAGAVRTGGGSEVCAS